MLTRIWVIATGSFREAVRTKVFLNLLGLSFLILVGGVAVDAGALGDAGRIYHDIAHAAISISGSMVAIFVGVHLIATDIERKTLHVLLARPVHRFEIVLGKYLGLAGVLGVNTAIATLLYSVVALGGVATSLNPAGILSIAILYCQFLVVAAIAIMFSTLSGTTTASIFSVMLYVVGRLGEQMTMLSERSLSTTMSATVKVFRTVLPDLTSFDLSPHLEQMPNAGELAMRCVYALLWCLALLTIGALVFQKRDLK